MRRTYRYLASILLGAALILPAGIQAAVNRAQDERHDRDDKHDRDNKRVKRYYDRDRKDYHDWDDREAARYRHWLTEERHEQRFRDYSRLNRQQQAEYWRWRHEHPDSH